MDVIDDVAGGEIPEDPCDDCPYDQENGNEMRMNIERTHEERRPYNCDVRDSDNDNRGSHRKHTETEYEESYLGMVEEYSLSVNYVMHHSVCRKPSTNTTW